MYRRIKVTLLILITLHCLCASCFCAVNFDGWDDKILVGPGSYGDPDLAFGTGDFSFSFWLFVDTWGDSKSRGIAGAKVADNSDGWLIYNDGGQPTKINARLKDTNNFFTGSSVTTGIWQHWALTRSGTTVTWYLNGALDNTGTNGQDIVLNCGGLNPNCDTPYIGYNETHNGFFDGMINDFAIWKGVALSAQEVSILANSRCKRMPLQIQPTYLVLYYAMDEFMDGTSDNYDTFLDFSTGGNGGTGDDGANNTGLTQVAEPLLTYP